MMILIPGGSIGDLALLNVPSVDNQMKTELGMVLRNEGMS
jgi:hypothetical protein